MLLACPERWRAHARHHAFPQVIGNDLSTKPTPKKKDPADHRAFCDPFLHTIRANTTVEYEGHRKELRRLSSIEDAIDDVRLDILKNRLV